MRYQGSSEKSSDYWSVRSRFLNICGATNVSIGAGSGGASAAYYINNFKDPCSRINVTVYERSDYVGGRSTTVDVFEDPAEPVELGASIFVKVNRNLVSAVEELGLGIIDYSSSKIDDMPKALGVWNGDRFVFVQSQASYSWWNIVKLFWKYGMNPYRTQKLMKNTTGQFLKMYDPPYFPFKDLSQTVYDLGLTASTSSTGEQFLLANNIQPPFSTDIIQASTRVNYAQNLGQIHGLETIVCMATDGAMSVQGGNWRIFAGMLEASGANVLLNTSVTSISHDGKSNTYALASTSQLTNSKLDTYDTIILSAPLQFANLTLPSSITPPPAIPYVSLHVTLFTSPHLLSPSVFNLSNTSTVPTTILTTTNDPHSPNPPFFSISTLRSVTNPSTNPPRREYLYKIFSPAPISSSYLSHLLGLSSLSKDDITWLYEKLWHSYPYLPPRVTFEDVQLDAEGKVWYTSGIESFISTMETSSLMEMNVARLVVDGWGKEGGKGEPDALSGEEGVEAEL